jgi:Caenorhabditis protein of unknown function, DUF268.
MIAILLNKLKTVMRTFLRYFLNKCLLIKSNIKAYYKFLSEYFAFCKLTKKIEPFRRFNISYKNWYPCLDDDTGNTGFDAHYIFHTAWAARILKNKKPIKHIDISSSLYFCSIISAFIPIDFYDYRPATLNLNGLNSKQGDLLNLPFKDNSINSLSCMHVVEHIGLGRYGDKLDPEGDIRAINELKRVLSPSGDLLFVVPICGFPRICFNAHRIYSYNQIISLFSELKLIDFSLVSLQPNKAPELIHNASKEYADKEIYGCGCFWFLKI